ncbi:hypothetical protein Taro_000276 [Colocasia esculenta]|uniref:Uncharacterized protein n=1 Tax=Colocasia esculenta TaxID=4460 RepID=A0A843TCI2_COLES|nr:hypothetical protein [Colocasia esculenta]
MMVLVFFNLGPRTPTLDAKNSLQISGLMQSEVEEDHDIPQPFSTSPALQTCYSRPQLSSGAEANKQSHRGHKEFILVRPFPYGSPPLGILLSKGTVPLKGNTTHSTQAGLLLFSGKKAVHFFYRSRSQPPDCQPLGGLQGL